MYRPILQDQVDGVVFATFPDGLAFEAPAAAEMPGVEAGLLGGHLICAPADLDDDTPARLLKLEGDAIERMDDVFFGGTEWTVFLSVIELENQSTETSLLDFNDANTGGVRIDITETAQIQVRFMGSELATEPFVSNTFDVGDNVYICLKKRVDRIELIVNGDLVGSRVFENDSSLGIYQGLIGGRQASSSVDSVFGGKIAMFAIYDVAISDDQLSRLVNRLKLTNLGTAFAAATPVNTAPEFLTSPFLDGGSLPGAPVVGEVLRVEGTDVSGYPTPTLSYQWQTDGVAIGGATSSTFTVRVEDIGKALNCIVTATNTGGTDELETNPTEDVIAA